MTPMACTPRPAPFESDEDLIDYCDTHCRTPVALFTHEQVARVCALAGVRFEDDRAWVQVYRSAMGPIVEKARARLREAA